MIAIIAQNANVLPAHKGKATINMNYLALKNHYIKIPANGQTEFNAGEGVVLVPPDNTKIFLHWTNDKGKLVTTYTLNYATLVQNTFKIINGSANPISIHAIEIGKKSLD